MDWKAICARLGAYLAPLAVWGCSSTQVNYNTLEIASTYDQLMTKQVTFNLRKSIEDKYGLPAFVKITNQTATTLNSITPNFTFPLSDQISRAVQATVAATGISNLSSRTSQVAGKTLGISAVDQWQQTYTLSPVTDTDQLRRLRTLFQYVVGHLSEDGADATKELESIYPIIVTTGGIGTGTGASTTSLSVTVAGRPVTVLQTSVEARIPPKTTYVRRTYLSSPTAEAIGTDPYTWDLVSPDLTFIRQPGCVLCDYGSILSETELSSLSERQKKNIEAYRTAHKLEKNRQLRNDWLYLPGQPVASDAIALPYSGLTTLYARRAVDGELNAGLKYFYELVLFSEDAASQGTGSPASGGQSDGRKSVTPQRVNIPVGGIVSSQ